MHTHTVWGAPSPRLFCYSTPCFVSFPSPSTVQSSQALGTAWGEQHVWLPGTPKQQQPTPYTHSIYRKHYLAHTALDYNPTLFWIPWMFLLVERLGRQNHDVLWLAFCLVWVCVCVCVCFFVRVCEMSLYLLSMSGCYDRFRACFVLDSIDMDLDWFWDVHWILFFYRPCLPSVPPMADMGLLSRLLFILLHDWNYTCLMNDRVNLIHLDDLVCCVWLWMSLSVLCVFSCYCFCSVWYFCVLCCTIFMVNVN